MTLEDMIALYRAQAMDIADPPFCSDELLTLYANEGQDEACRRGQLIRDASSRCAPWPTLQVTSLSPWMPALCRCCVRLWTATRWM